MQKPSAKPPRVDPTATLKKGVRGNLSSALISAGFR